MNEIVTNVLAYAGIAAVVAGFAWSAFKAVAKFTENKTDDEIVEQYDPYVSKVLQWVKSKNKKNQS